MRKKASNWNDAAEVIDQRPAESESISYGLSMAVKDNEIWVDFGDETKGDLIMAKLTFRNRDQANRAYCKGIKLQLKIVEHPEHEL